MADLQKLIREAKDKRDIEFAREQEISMLKAKYLAEVTSIIALSTKKLLDDMTDKDLGKLIINPDSNGTAVKLRYEQYHLSFGRNPINIDHPSPEFTKMVEKWFNKIVAVYDNYTDAFHGVGDQSIFSNPWVYKNNGIGALIQDIVGCGDVTVETHLSYGKPVIQIVIKLI